MDTLKVKAVKMNTLQKEYYEEKYGICTFEAKDFRFDNLDDDKKLT